MTLLTFVFPPLFYMRIADATIENKEVTERLDLFLNPLNESVLKDMKGKYVQKIQTLFYFIILYL